MNIILQHFFLLKVVLLSAPLYGQIYEQSYEQSYPQSKPSFICTSGDPNEFCTFVDVKLDGQDLYYEFRSDKEVSIPKVQFNSSNISVLTNAVCLSFPNVWDLRLWFLSMTSIQADAFDDCTDLKILNLHENRLTTLDQNIFAKTTHLEIVILTRNRLMWMSTAMFASSVSSLHQLALGDNSLQTFEIDSGVYFTKLEELSLEHNYLTQLDVEVLKQNFPQIRKLDLVGNQFNCTRSREIIEVMKGFDLQKLAAEACKDEQSYPQSRTSFTCTSGDTNDFCTFVDVKLESKPQVTLKFDKNLDYEFRSDKEVHIPKVQFNSSRIPVLTNAVCTSFPHVWDLRLWFMSMISIQADAFDGCTDLQILNMHENLLTSLDQNIFAKTTHLQKVILTRNRLTRMSSAMFASSALILRQLSLGNNSLNMFEIDSGVDFPKLEVLSLEHNQLTQLEVEVLKKKFPQINKFDLVGNQFNCTQSQKIAEIMKGLDLKELEAVACKDDKKGANKAKFWIVIAVVIILVVITVSGLVVYFVWRTMQRRLIDLRPEMTYYQDYDSSSYRGDAETCT